MRKKRPSASDVLRQEMQQPLVLPVAADSAAAAELPPDSSPQTNSISPNITTMNAPNSDDAAAKLKAAQEAEAKLKQQVADLQSKLQAQTQSAEQLQAKTETLTKELKDAKKIALELSAPTKAPAKSTAIVKKDSTHASLTARPTQSREETALRRANTDIGWLD